MVMSAVVNPMQVAPVDMLYTLNRYLNHDPSTPYGEFWQGPLYQAGVLDYNSRYHPIRVVPCQGLGSGGYTTPQSQMSPGDCNNNNNVGTAVPPNNSGTMYTFPPPPLPATTTYVPVHLPPPGYQTSPPSPFAILANLAAKRDALVRAVPNQQMLVTLAAADRDALVRAVPNHQPLLVTGVAPPSPVLQTAVVAPGDAVYPTAAEMGAPQVVPSSAVYVSPAFTSSPLYAGPAFTSSPATVSVYQPVPQLSVPQPPITQTFTVAEWKQRYGMESFWVSNFLTLFNQFGPNSWTLLPVSETPKGSWNSNVDSAKVRFSCNGCGHGWTSMKGRVAFWFILNPVTSRGVVCLKLYGQQCDKCKSGEYESAMWYHEEVERVMKNIYNKVGEFYYGFQRVPYQNERRAGKPRTAHNATLCQACSDGVCAERR